MHKHLAAVAVTLALLSVPSTLFITGRVREQQRLDLCHATQNAYDTLHNVITNAYEPPKGTKPDVAALYRARRDSVLHELDGRPSC